jgi:hypothetical protein
MRGLAEGTPELTTEVCGREAGGACEGGNVQRLAVTGVDQVLCTEEMAGGRHGREHRPQVFLRWRATALADAEPSRARV